MITRLIEALHSIGLEPTAEEIADILWLAPYLDKPAQSGDEVPPGAGQTPFGTAFDTLRADTDTQHPSRPLDEVAKETPKTRPAVSDVYLPKSEGSEATGPGLGGLAFRSPAASALPGELAIGRALRPLMRRVPSRTQFVLDEEATVQRIADEGNWVPVLRPAPSRWLEVVLVVDEWPSMVIWRQAITELQRLLERQGAFRNVLMWGFVTEAETGRACLHVGTGPEAAQSQTRSPRELIDPRGQRLILVVSDCVSPAWYNGEVARMLSAWGQNGLVAIVQVLPRRLWVQSALGNAVQVHMRALTPGTPNTQLEVELPWDLFDGKPPAGLPVPVIILEPRSIAPWAQSVAGIAGVWISGKVLPAASSEESKPLELDVAMEPEEPAASLSPERRLQLFRATASPLAWRLAGYLAAAPLSLPVMRLVQRVMLPESRQAHLAEVFLSGLIKRQTPNDPSIHPDDVRYDFVDGVRDLLLSTILVSETVEVLTKVSNFIDRETGKPLDFRALIADPTATGRIVIEKDSQPFAAVATRVLHRLGGRYAQLATHLERIEGIKRAESEDLSLEEDGLSLRPSARTRAWLEASEKAVAVLGGEDAQQREEFQQQSAALVKVLSDALGLVQLESRSYMRMHGYVVEASDLRLRVPSRFPVVFPQCTTYGKDDIVHLADFMGVLGMTDFFALLVAFDLPGDGKNVAGLRRLVKDSPYAHDFIVLGNDDVLSVLKAKDPNTRLIQLLLDQVGLSLVSPYTVYGPVLENMFFGREDEIKTIVQTIKDSDFALTGGRKIGKTSTLRKVYRLLGKNDQYSTFYLDCQAILTYHEFFYVLGQKLERKLDADPASFRDVVTWLKREAGDRMIVVLLDEVDDLLTYDVERGESLFKVFRSLSQEGYCRFIFCGSKSLYRRIHHPDSPLFNFCKDIILGPLDEKSAAEIITRPMDDMDIELQDRDQLVDRIIRISSCHPNLVQFICERLINRIQAPRITLEDLHKVTTTQEFYQYFIEIAWGQSTLLEKIITLAMLNNQRFARNEVYAILEGMGIRNRAAIDEALEALELYALLRRDGKNYSYALTEFPRIVRESEDVEALIESMLRRTGRESEDVETLVESTLRRKDLGFVTHGPLNPETDRFIGRTSELKEMESWLTKVRNYGAVVGARQTGKTSLLLKFRHDLQARYGFVFVDLMELHGVDVAQCYRRLSQEITEQLEEVLDSQGLELASTGAEFHDFLREVARRSRPPRLVIILDEVGALPRETAQSLASTMRAVFSQRHIQRLFDKFIFIFSGADILEFAIGGTSPLRNVTKVLYVPDFSREETTKLITAGLEKAGLAVDPAISDRIYQWTHGHPYLSQRLGALVLKIAKGDPRLTVPMVDMAVERLQAGDVNLQHLINSLQADSRAEVKVGEILRPGSQIHFSRNDPVLSQLEIIGVIRDEKGLCVIRNRIYEDLLQEFYSSIPEPLKKETVTAPIELREEMIKGNCVLFIGPGLSVGAGLPGWYSLIDELAKRIGYELPPAQWVTGDALIEAARVYINEQGLHSLVNFLRGRLDTATKSPTAAHQALARLPISLVFTANYDDLLERAYQDAGKRFHVVVRDSDIPFTHRDSDAVNIVKLFGDLDQPDTIVLARQQYEAFFLQQPQMIKLLETELGRSTVLCLGWSHSDPHFDLVFGELFNRFGEFMRPPYAVMFDLSEARRKELERKHIRLVQLPDKGDRTRQLATWLNSLTPGNVTQQ